MMEPMPLGLYLSVPFCRTKCSYCNFASDVFSKAKFQEYVDRVSRELARAPQIAAEMGGAFDREVDSIYLGGGTPSVLAPDQLAQLFRAIRDNFDLQPGAEVTAECAPGTLTPEILDSLLRGGVNRVSLGVQSFVDQESCAVGRLHTRATTLDDIARLRAAAISEINIDLIAGLPHQTADSWRASLDETIATGAPHVSVYMLEVDEDSRLGRELIAGGTRYHAHFVPDEDLTADLYLAACERLNAAGIPQYEISNFAHPGHESRHNLKYWTRRPYLGFGVDAHSMLPATTSGLDAVRFAWPDSLDDFLAGKPLARTLITSADALEETFFLGLRLNRGVNLSEIRSHFMLAPEVAFGAAIHELTGAGLLESDGRALRLTPRGRLLSNEVFQRFLGSASVPR